MKDDRILAKIILDSLNLKDSIDVDFEEKTIKKLELILWQYVKEYELELRLGETDLNKPNEFDNRRFE